MAPLKGRGNYPPVNESCVLQLIIVFPSCFLSLLFAGLRFTTKSWHVPPGCSLGLGFLPGPCRWKSDTSLLVPTNPCLSWKGGLRFQHSGDLKPPRVVSRVLGTHRDIRRSKSGLRRADLSQKMKATEETVALLFPLRANVTPPPTIKHKAGVKLSTCSLGEAFLILICSSYRQAKGSKVKNTSRYFRVSEGGTSE